MTIKRILADGTIESGATDGTGVRFKAVQSTAPSTSGWSVGDLWLDTSTVTSTVAATIRQWNGSVFMPTPSGGPTLGTLLLSDDFTGTDGAVWNASNWAVGANSTAGAGSGATLLSNSGRLQTSDVGAYAASGRISRRAVIATDPADVNILHRIQFDGTESYFNITARDTSGALANGSGNCYLFLVQSTGGWSIHVGTAGSFGASLGSGDQTFAITAGTWYWIRFRVVGSSISGKMWADGTTEPGTAPVSVTDTTYTAAGKVGFTLRPGNAASNSRVFLDDVSIRAS